MLVFSKERDIILNALYGHFGKHRIDSKRFHDYLLEETDILPSRVDIVAEDLFKNGHVHINNIYEYQITPAGQELLEVHNGYVGKQGKESQSQLNIDLSNAKIKNSQIGNQSRGGFLAGKKHTMVDTTSINANVESTVKPKTFIANIFNWIKSNRVLSAVIAGLILYFAKIQLDKKYGTNPNNPKTETTQPTKR